MELKEGENGSGTGVNSRANYRKIAISNRWQKIAPRAKNKRVKAC